MLEIFIFVLAKHFTSCRSSFEHLGSKWRAFQSSIKKFNIIERFSSSHVVRDPDEKLVNLINLTNFMSLVSFYSPENVRKTRFSHVFRGYKKEQEVWSDLMLLSWKFVVLSFKHQPHKMVKHNCLSVFDHFVGLALKGLNVCKLLDDRLRFYSTIDSVFIMMT